jgi:hypothetical protein
LKYLSLYWPGPRVHGGDSGAIRDQVVQRACADYRAGLII